MIIQREIYKTELNEFGVPHNVVIGYEEVDIEPLPEEETPEQKIAKLQEELNKLKEQL
jgi:hypothetical protein